jgi:hypothetical protein
MPKEKPIIEVCGEPLARACTSFCVTEMMLMKPMHSIQPVKIVPDGFRYRGQVHKSLNALIAWYAGSYSFCLLVTERPLWPWRNLGASLKVSDLYCMLIAGLSATTRSQRPGRNSASPHSTQAMAKTTATISTLPST